MWKKAVDIVSAAFIATPFICVAWGYLLLALSPGHRFSRDGFTIFGFLPAPVEILIAGIPLCVFGVIWLIVRYANALYRKYPKLQDRLIVWGLIPIMLLVLGKELLQAFGR